MCGPLPAPLCPAGFLRRPCVGAGTGQITYLEIRTTALYLEISEN